MGSRYLALTDEPRWVSQICQGGIFGENYDGYWTNELLMRQVRKAAAIALIKYPKEMHTYQRYYQTQKVLLSTHKYHPELNPIELCWAKAKRYAREHCNYSFEGLKAVIPTALSTFSVETISKLLGSAVITIVPMWKGKQVYKLHVNTYIT